MDTDESGEKKDETQSKDKGGEEKIEEGKEKVHYAVSDLGLHCLLWSYLGVIWYSENDLGLYEVKTYMNYTI